MQENKTMITRIGALIIALCLILSIVFSLSSCYTPAVTPEEDDSITEEQFATLAEDLKSNVDAGCPKKYSYVASYLMYWGFPYFHETKLKTIERYYSTRYIEDLGYSSSDSILELATRVANHYIENVLPSLTIEDVNGAKGSDEIIRSYVASIGDKYSKYRNPEETFLYDSELEGAFAGIGVYVTLDYNAHTITVVETITDAAAEAAGILPGDLIVKIDDTSIDGTDLDVFMDLIKGEIGSPVSVTVKRGDEEITYTMNRVEVEETSVSYELLEDGTAYVVIASFNANTDEQFISIINEIEATGRLKGYIFDLRYNGGGYLDTAVNIISHFIPKNVRIVSQVTRDEEYWHYSNSDHVISVPMVVLCNGYTASAGELFTAAIRDYRDVGMLSATIIGENTYGKGRVQSIYTISDGSCITLTVGLFNPPSDVNFDGVGVIPDIEVVYEPSPDVDNQYEAAYAELQKLINANK